MRSLPDKLKEKITSRKADNALRELVIQEGKTDFASNDYLGFARDPDHFNTIGNYLHKSRIEQTGSTGSRLLSGNNSLFEITEKYIADFHKSGAALIFNSGYDANLGFFSAVPQREDLIIYDEYSHASIRDGIAMSKAKAFKFRHNDQEDLKTIIHRHKNRGLNHSGIIYVITESVFSMDGDSPDLISLANICLQEDCLLVVDEAHAIGIFGENGRGLIDDLKLNEKVFARIVTFGKSLGCHGAAVLGSPQLKKYLVNFARSFIYTTALSPHAVASIYQGYKLLSSEEGTKRMTGLSGKIEIFKKSLKANRLEKYFIHSDSAIHCCLIQGNNRVKSISDILQNENFDVRPILSPTVPEDTERLRFCLHAFNTADEIESVLKLLAKSLNML